MSLPVLVAVTGAAETTLVAGLERGSTGVHVARRCVDLAELLSAAAAGIGRVAVVSADLHRLDREAVALLHRHGVALVGLVEPADDAGRRRLVELGVGTVVAADLDPPRVAEAVLDAAAEFPARPGADGPDPADGRRRPPSGGARWSATADPADALAAPDGPAAGMPAAGGAAGRAGPRPPSGGRVVAVWGPTGAPGRTTVALSLAGELAHRGLDTLLVDADTYGPSVAQALGLLDEGGGVAAAARSANLGALDVDRLAHLAPSIHPALRVLTGLPRPSRWPELRPSALDQVWERARELVRWTVVDCGFCLEADEELSLDTAAPRRNGATLSALAAADLVLVVGSADPVGLHRLVRALDDLGDAFGPALRSRVVVTRVRASAVGTDPERRVTSALQRYAGIGDAWLVPDDRTACDEALFAGRMLVEIAPDSPARRAFHRLAADVTALLRYDGPVPRGPRRHP